MLQACLRGRLWDLGRAVVVHAQRRTSAMGTQLCPGHPAARRVATVTCLSRPCPGCAAPVRARAKSTARTRPPADASAAAAGWRKACHRSTDARCAGLSVRSRGQCLKAAPQSRTDPAFPAPNSVLWRSPGAKPPPIRSLPRWRLIGAGSQTCALIV